MLSFSVSCFSFTARNEIGSNRECWVPAPSLNSSFHLEFFEFVGQLIGLALRTGNVIPLHFPSLVWKYLVDDPVNEADVTAIDSLAFDRIRQIEEVEQMHAADHDSFDAVLAEVQATLAVLGSDQVMHILPLSSASSSSSSSSSLSLDSAPAPVTWNNRNEFKMKLREV